MRKRVLKILVGLVMLTAVMPLTFNLARQLYFQPTVPATDYPLPANRTEAWQQDLDYFEHYLRWNRPYTEGSGKAARTHIEMLAANIDALSDTELKLGITHAVALANNGHSAVWIPDMTMGIGRIPLMGRMFADGYNFLWSTPAYAEFLGMKLVTINGHPVDEVIAAFRPYSGANDSLFRLLVGWYLETPGLVHALGFSDSPTRYTLGLQRPFDDQIHELTLTVAGPTPDYPIVGTVLVLQPANQPGWVSLATQRTQMPTFLQDLDQPFEQRPLPEIDGLYVRYTANEDVGTHKIEAFNEEVETAVRQHNPAVLIIDQRLNGGGDYTRTADTMTALPKLLDDDARIYLLTSPLTFSAGISSVAFLKASGGEQVTIVGEAIGDNERMWGETVAMTLPNSQLSMSLATGLHDYRDGCYEFPHCYWLDFFNNVAVGSLAPDVTIPFTFTDYVAGKDAVFEAILNWEKNDS